MIVAMNYANIKFKHAQQFNSVTAISKGKADKVVSYSPHDIDSVFKNKNKHILSARRGNGYWLWKPYFIHKTINLLEENDYLVYLDSGAFYINDVRHLIKQMEKDNQYIMTFELPYKERYYTKRDVFICMGCDEIYYTESNQRMATMIILKKTNESVKFVNEWLYYAQLDDIITDEKNCFGKENYVRFVDHRHDQSIFSVLSKKYMLKTYRDPSQFGRYPDIFWKSKIEKLENKSGYPQVIALHRARKVTRKVFFEQMLYAHAPKSIVKFYVDSNLEHGKRDENKIAVLTDNMPIGEEYYGYGMYKVVDRLIRALGENIDSVICTDRNYCSESIDARMRDGIIVKNKFHNMQGTGLEQIYFLLEMIDVISELRKKKIKKVFIPLGANYRELENAFLLSKVYHISVSIYIVDDFLEHYNKILGKRDDRLYKKIVRYLKEVDRIFVISSGMRDRIYKLTGRKSIVLPLPYQWKKLDNNDQQKKEQIMFLGNINDLYIQGLKDIVSVVEEINNETGRQIQLLFTYNSSREVKRMLGNFECIISRRIETEDELRREMRDSIFCFMPYTEDECLSLLQNTSFPSKLIEYMSSARSIVIYGNNKNSAQYYFDQNCLPRVIYGRDKEALKKCIIAHFQVEKDYSSRYADVLKRNHSFASIRKRILFYI